MSIAPSPPHAGPQPGRTPLADTAERRPQTRVVLQPVAAPSILGLFGFAAATFIVSAHLVGWYGSDDSPLYLAPFAAMFGGLAQFVAGVVGFRARDGLATAMHGMWGSFWLAYGLLQLLGAVGALTLPLPDAAFPELGFWFLTLAAITLVGTIAALADTFALMLTLLALTVGAGLLAVAYLVGSHPFTVAGAYVLLASALLAFYVASALLLAGSFGRKVLPTGELGRNAEPWGRRPPQLADGATLDEPGIRRGQ